MTRRKVLRILALLAGVSLASVGEASSARRKSKRARAKQPATPLDINRASVEELERLPGIGPVTAQAIVSYREKNGPFRRLEELMIIRGISEEKLEKLRPWLTLGK